MTGREITRTEAWISATTHLHERVRLACWDSLAGQMLTLHQPHVEPAGPVCRGCDRAQAGDDDPVWPCRTYTLMAVQLLAVPSAGEVEKFLVDAFDRARCGLR